MRILFNPEAEAHGFIDLGTSAVAINEIHVDENGLLEQLELRTGLSYTAFSDMEREAFYLQNLKKCYTGTFFEKSFEADEWGTARQLLQWRDTLVMAGWTKKVRGISTLLDCMADIDPDLLPLGACDRWRRVYSELQKNNPLKKKDCIEVHCAVELVSPLVLQVLDLLKDNVKYCHYTNDDKTLDALPANLSDCKCNVKMLEFADRYNAYLWLACSKDITDKTVVVNRDNKMLDNVLYSVNQPEIQSSIQDGNPGIIQLFKLGFSLFERPVNVNNLLSYLQLTMHPLPGKLRGKLASRLQKEGGRGEEWEKIIKEFDFTVKKEKEGKEVKKNLRNEKMEFLKPLEGENEAGISRDDVLSFSNALSDWAKKRQFSGQSLEKEIPQLTTLRGFCAALNRVLDDAEETIEQETLMKWVKNIYRPIRMGHSTAQCGSVNVIRNILGLMGSPEKLIWLDCNYEGNEKYPYDFLNKNEIEGLQKNGVNIVSEAAMLKAVHDDRIRAIAKIQKELVVATAVRDGNELLHEHPFVAELKKHGCSVEPAPEITKDLEEADCIGYPPQYYYHIQDGKDFTREQESYSSLEKLIQHPFDYVSDFFAGLSDYESGALPNMNTTLGKVAHLMIQTLTEDADYDIDKMQKLFDSKFDQYLNEALNATGAILLLQENRLELEDFTKKIKNSIPVLIEIIRQNELKPVACEKDVIADLKVIGNFKAVIDMLLVDQNGKKVVFDFKWSKTSNYREKLEKDSALQLELYRQALLANDEEFGGSAYYIFPDAKLLSYDSWKGPAGAVELIPAPADHDSLFKRIQNSFKYRKEELKDGNVEEGETLPMKSENADDPSVETVNFEYLKKTDVIPLESAYGEDNKNLKGSPYVAKPKKKKKDFKKTKLSEKPNEQLTTHTILKGHVK